SGKASQWGGPSHTMAGKLTATLMQGAAWSVPASYQVGLSITIASRFGTVFPPDSGTGYAHVVVPNNLTTWTAAGTSGAKSNAIAFNFPAATKAYTVKSVWLGDPAGSGRWYVWNLASPLVVNVGDTPTIPIGAMTFSNVPMPGSTGGYTDYGW